MAVWHAKVKKKRTGGKSKTLRDKRKKELGRMPAMTKASTKVKVTRLRGEGGVVKNRALETNYANILDPKTKKYQKAEIKKVLENSASRHFARMAVITKGAILETSLGKAKVTNRPGQEGYVNAVLI